MHCRILASAIFFSTLGTATLAQQSAEMMFRLTAGDRNPSACQQVDAAMSRPQSVTIVGDTAVLKSNGGINGTAKQADPGVYKSKWTLANVTFDIEVNASTKTLTVAEPKLGCKWSGTSS